ncbi:MAG: sulfatase-like hydrolase/transferase [Rhodobacteraceae bacterium]|nr:sulfatase-like hydrolase/transferase [Paracoccaceae bacterium]
MTAPNIVYLMFDQAKASAMSFMGNADITMPFCDGLARNGWVFDQAYAAAPICTPSRASVHTGLFPQVHGVTCHQNRAPFNVPQLAEVLSAGGYYTAAAGHYEPERNLGRGWHEQSPMHERGPLFNSWMAHIQSGRRDVAWSSGTIEVDAKDGNSALLTDRALRMLDQAEASGRPFFLHMCYDDPHPPYFVPKPYDTMFDPDSLPLPDLGNLDDLPDWHKKARSDVGTDQASPEDYCRVLAIYYGMIRYIDDQMARIYQYLDDKGLLENTWIILGSDHGDYTGEKGLFNKSESHYKCLLHVPLVIVPPKNSDEPKPRRISDLVSTVDLFPTLLAMAGLAPPTNQGKDLLGWVRSGHAEPIREVVIAQVGDYQGFIKTSWPSGMPEAGRHKSLTHSIRTLDKVYIQDPDNGDEAYDLSTDPRELRNLAQQPDFATDPHFLGLKHQLSQFQQDCLTLRDQLGVVAGDRGFVKGWE